MTVIAAGFDGGQPKRRDEGATLRREGRQPQLDTRSAAAAVATRRSEPAAAPSGTTAMPVGAAKEQPATEDPARESVLAGSRRQAPAPLPFDDDDLDVPDFLK